MHPSGFRRSRFFTSRFLGQRLKTVAAWTLLGLTTAVFPFSNTPALAQQTPGDESSLRAALAGADAELNALYQQLMRARSPAGRREQLRGAERAWVAFNEKNNAALRAATAGERGVPTARRLQISLLELRARCEELRQMATGQGFSGGGGNGALAAADGELNRVYRQCLAALDPGEASALREAQRAWVAFRDEHARASGLGAATSAAVTARRSAQMRAVYLAPGPGMEFARPGRAEAAAVTEPEPAHEPVDPTTPDPFARAR